MIVYFKDKKLMRSFDDERECLKQYGKDNSRKIQTRYAELLAADNLEVIPHVPPARLHELSGNRRGQFSVTIKEPFRIIFVPANNPIPLTTDGGIDKRKITEILIIEVVDYHGE
jgi:proteic killer suppression protein